MYKETLLKHLQSWTNSVPLIILGSGASIPFKLPSMSSLGDYIKENVFFLLTLETKPSLKNLNLFLIKMVI
jgi:hypothetical protein